MKIRVDHPLPGNQLIARHDRSELVPRVLATVLPDDALLVGGRRVAQGELDHEAVELRYRQREQMGTLEVHGGDDEKRVRQPVRGALHGHRLLLHRLQEAALRLGSQEVDLVTEHEVREQGTAREGEGAAGHVVAVEAQDVLRQQVDRALYAAEVVDIDVVVRGLRRVPADGRGQRLGERGLTHAVRIGQNDVAAGQLGCQQMLHLAGVDGDDRADVVDDAADAVAGAAHGIGGCAIIRLTHGSSRRYGSRKA